ALRDAQALAVATFLSPERLGYPPGRSQRERLLARSDGPVPRSEATAEAAATRFPGDYTVVSPGVDLDLFRPGEKRRLAVLEWRPTERPLARAVIRALREVPDWELILLRTKPLAGHPYRPASLRDRIHVRTARDGRARAPIFAEASVVVPALTGLQRVPLEAAAAGAAIAAPPGMQEQPELAAAAFARLAEDDDYRARTAARNRAEAETQSFDAVAAELDALYRRLARRRRPRRAADPLADREWILCDLHTHTSWSHDCGVEVSELLDHAELEGLGAIAVTDHNALGGALEAVEPARGPHL